MRYVISEPVSYQEATPRGILEGTFEAGPIEVEPGSDEHFIVEYVLIPDGLAVPATAKTPKAKTKADEAPKE